MVRDTVFSANDDLYPHVLVKEVLYSVEEE